jgi:hypothetical protein
VLIVGGQDVSGIDNAVDIYDTTNASSYYNNDSYYNTPTGVTGDLFASALCTDTTAPTPCLNTPRIYHTATLLKDGRVLVVGGTADGSDPLASIEIWSSSNNGGQGGFTVLGSLATARLGHSAELLENGDVLIFGGVDAAGSAVNTAEVVDPNWVSDEWASASIPAGPMTTNRALASSTSLFDGSVLVAGGFDPTATPPTTKTTSEDWTATQGYQVALPETVSLTGLGSQVPVSSTGQTASVSIPNNNIVHYSWTVGSGASITAGQGTSTITYTSSSSTQQTASVLVTDEFGQSQLASATSPTATCAAPTSATVNLTGSNLHTGYQDYVYQGSGYPIYGYLTGLRQPQNSSVTSINWNAYYLTGNYPHQTTVNDFTAVSTNGTATSGDDLADKFGFYFPNTTNNSVFVTAMVTVKCSDNVSNSATFTWYGTLNVDNDPH